MIKPPTNILAVGIDPAKRKHQGVALVYPEIVLLTRSFPNNFEEILKFDKKVEEIAQSHSLNIVYGLEDVGIYGKGMRDILLNRGREIVEVNPIKTNRQKDFYGQDKSDEIDARCIAAIVLRSYRNLPEVKPVDDTVKTIREVSREREALVCYQTQNKNRLHFYLTKVYLGSYKDFFSHLDGKMALEFFARYPLPQSLGNAGVEELSEFFYKVTGRRMKKKAESILKAVRFLKEQEVTEEQQFLGEAIKHLALIIKETKGMIEKMEEYLKSLLDKTDQTLTTFTGIDTVTAAVIIGETLTLSRFRNRNAFAKYNGTGPCEDSSGDKKRWVANKRCNRRLKRTFYQVALSAAQYNPISQRYYKRLITRGFSKREALKRLARRISDIIYAMMRDGTEYDPQKAMARIRARERAWGKVAISQRATGGSRRNNEPYLTPSPDYKQREEKIKEAKWLLT